MDDNIWIDLVNSGWHDHRSTGDKPDIVLAALAVSFAETLARGDLSRLEICQNKDWRLVFVDKIPNRSRRCCEDSCRKTKM